jgi:hypothetical protein
LSLTTEPTNHGNHCYDLLLEAVKQATGIADLELESNATIRIRYNSAVIMFRVYDDGSYALIDSPLLHEIEESDLLLRVLNELNAKQKLVSFYLDGSTVFAEAGICIAPFVAAHVIDAFARFCDAINGVEQMLQLNFGGNKMFSDLKNFDDALNHQESAH